MKDILDEMIAAEVKAATKALYARMRDLFVQLQEEQANLHKERQRADQIAKERVAERSAAAVKRAELEAELTACKAALAIKVDEIAGLIDAAGKAAPPTPEPPEQQLDLPIAGIEAAPDTSELL